MSWQRVREYYMRSEVKGEIAEYCVGRWVAVHCEERPDGTRPMIRRWSRRRPLTIGSEEDVVEVLDRFSSLGPRAFYATAHIYRKLKSNDDLADRGNIVCSAPTWDIDSKNCD